MGLRTHVSQRQKRLGRELQRLRDAAGLSGTEAGSHIGLGRPHMSHIEAGRTHISEEKLRTLARVYGCTNDQLIDALVTLARSDGRGWWSTYRRFKGTRSRDLAEIESTATALRSFQWLHVPGLLQTPAYMRALFRRNDPGASERTVDEYVEFRLHRQQILTTEPLPRCHVVIHEAAFHMRFVDREVMAEQIRYLVEASQFPNIAIQIMPFSADAHSGTTGTPFTIYDTKGPALRTVYVEYPVTSVFLSDQNHIEQFANEFDQLCAASLSTLDPAGTVAEGSFGCVQHLLYVLGEARRVGP